MQSGSDDTMSMSPSRGTELRPHQALEGPGRADEGCRPRYGTYAAPMKIVVGVTDNRWAAFLGDHRRPGHQAGPGTGSLPPAPPASPSHRHLPVTASHSEPDS